MSFTNGLQLPSFGSGPLWTPDPNITHSFSLTNSTPHELDEGPLIDATLRRLEAAVNEDVEMQGALSEYLTYLVMDTNVLLDKLDVLQQFVSDVEALSIPVIVIIPGIVISELDHQKNRPGLEWRARRASTWLLEKVKERRSVKGQAHEETCKRSGKWNVKDPGERGGPEVNDDLILDCCEYFARVWNRGYHGRVVLCSSDKNLCFKSESKEILTVTPSRNWSSREIAKFLFGGHVDLGLFDAYSSSSSRQYRKGVSTGAVAVQHDDDMMDVDDTGDYQYIPPSHPLDALHLEVIDHFSRLLLELVDRAGGPEVPRAESKSEMVQSQHAPAWAKKPLAQWDAGDCLTYLGSKKRLNGPRRTPGLDVFLREPYSKQRGGRRGQDWSRRDWEISVDNLEEIGISWDDKPIQESVAILRSYADVVFSSPMRPTGTM